MYADGGSDACGSGNGFAWHRFEAVVVGWGAAHAGANREARQCMAGLLRAAVQLGGYAVLRGQVRAAAAAN